MTDKQSKPMRLRAKHPLAIRWFHWINFPVLFIMIWSGILIYWANTAYTLSIFGHPIFHFFPDKVSDNGTPVPWSENWFAFLHWDRRLAEGMAWHFTFMYVFTINGLLYLTYLVASKEWKEIVPNRASLKQAIQVMLHDIGLHKGPLPDQKFNGAQKFAYTGVIVMGFGSLVTGLAIFKPWQLPWITALVGGYEFARLLHFAFMILFCLFFLVHVAQVVRAGWNNFRAMVTGHELVPVEEVEIAS
jgi:thiosulfate reductase cytochrome b subunit